MSTTLPDATFNGLPSASTSSAPSITSSLSFSSIARTYPFETWMGHLAGNSAFAPPPSCEYITQAITTLIGPTSTTISSEYRNNITHWEDRTQHCRPPRPTVGPLTPGAGEFYYPGTCPAGWTSYVTSTTISLPASESSTPRPATFQDAMCCPKSYTGVHARGTEYFCTLFLRPTDQYGLGYSVYTWNLVANIDAAGVTGTKTSKLVTTVARSQRYIGVKLSSSTTLTYWPVFVRFANPTATFVPTKTGEGLFARTHNPSQTDVADASQAEEKTKQDLIVGISVAVGVIAVLSVVVWAMWKSKRSPPAGEGASARERAKLEKRERRRREYEERIQGAKMKGRHPRDEEEKVLSDEKVEGVGKPELMGSVYVGPQLDGKRIGDGEGKPELDGGALGGARAGGVVRSLEDLKYDEMNLHDETAFSNLEDGSGRYGLVGSELDHQSRRRGVADAELDVREQERRASELGASRAGQRRIARKQVPGRVASLDSQTSPQQLPQSDIPPHSPVLSGPIPDFTTMYPSPMDTEALEEERRLEYQEQRLRERREQLAREEEALRQKRELKRSGPSGV